MKPLSLPRAGKLDQRSLEGLVLKYVGAKRGDVLLGPSFGEDAGVVGVKGNQLVLSCDPITGARRKIGWLSVHINANDVAVTGAVPRWFSSCVLVPKNFDSIVLSSIMKDIHAAAISLNVSIVTGHTEVTPGLDYPIVTGFLAGLVEKGKFVSSGGAQPGDMILMTKTAGIEGTAVLAHDAEKRLERRVAKNLLNRAANYYRKISVVPEALAIHNSGLATAMHDPTEGGVLGGLVEMAVASRVGFLVREESIPVSTETLAICKALEIDPLKLIGSGTLLATLRKIDKSILRKLEKIGVSACIIGEIKESGRTIEKKDGTVEIIKGAPSEELWSFVT